MYITLRDVGPFQSDKGAALAVAKAKVPGMINIWKDKRSQRLFIEQA